MLASTAGALLVLLILEVQGLSPGLTQDAIESVQIIEENKLVHTSNPDAFLEIKRRTLVPANSDVPVSKPSPASNSWDDKTLNQKLMEVKLDEKARLKTNVNIYESGESGDVQNGDNNIGNTLQAISNPTSVGASISKTGTGSSLSLFQQIAAVSQMKNRYKSSSSGAVRNNTSSNNNTGNTGQGSYIRADFPTRRSSSEDVTEKKESLLKTKLRVVNAAKDKKPKLTLDHILVEKKDVKSDESSDELSKKKEISEAVSTPKIGVQRNARTVDLLGESIRPLYGVAAYSEVIPITLYKRSIESAAAKVNEIRHQEKTFKKGVKKQSKKRRGHGSHGKRKGRKRRSINTDYVNKKGKEVDFITAVKVSQPPPIVRVVPNDPIYYRHGRADEKLLVQSYDRDVQELIRHNVQPYVNSNHLDVSFNGQNDFLNRVEGQSRNGNQRRIVYYATLPEIVRRPNAVSLQDSPYWTNYMVPRELSGTSNQENEVIKVQSTMLDVRDPSITLIPVKTISAPSHQAEDASSRSDNMNIQPAPYYTGGYPMRHNRYPPPELPPLRPINFDLGVNSNMIGRNQHSLNSIPTIIPKHLEIHSPKSYEVNGKRYGIYDIPSLGDNAIKPLYDDRSYENNKFTNYEKFYKVPGTFEKHIDYFEGNSGDLDSDFDWSLGPIGANTKSSYSLKYVPSSVTYLPHNVVKTLDASSGYTKDVEPAVSSSTYKKDIIGKHSTNVVHSVTIETNNNNTNGTFKSDTPVVQIKETNRTVTIIEQNK